MRGHPRLRHALLAAFFACFVLFLYGPTATILLLSFQGPGGGLTFPLQGVSLHWFHRLFGEQMVGDLGGAFRRSFALALMVTAATVLVCVPAGLAFRRRFRGSGLLLGLTIASLIVPSILVSLGIGLAFSALGLDPAWDTSAFGAQLTWTLPFGVLIMFAIFSRFDPSWEEAARDLGATPGQVFQHVILPIIAPGIIGIALFGLTLSYDEFARTLLTAGSHNTLPLEIFGMTTNITTPVLYALGTVTTAISFATIGLTVLALTIISRRRASHDTAPMPQPTTEST